jgi:hypothetical protein
VRLGLQQAEAIIALRSRVRRRVLRFEILEASKRVQDPLSVTLATGG